MTAAAQIKFVRQAFILPEISIFPASRTGKMLLVC